MLDQYVLVAVYPNENEITAALFADLRLATKALQWVAAAPGTDVEAYRLYRYVDSRFTPTLCNPPGGDDHRVLIGFFQVPPPPRDTLAALVFGVR